MKRYYFLIVAALMLSSCEKFLNYTPDQMTTEDNFWRDDADAKAAIAAVYGSVYSQADEGYSRTLMYEICGGSDDMVFGRNATARWSALVNYNYPTSGSESNNPAIIHGTTRLWQNALTRANWVIYDLIQAQKKSGLSEVGMRTLGEGYFLRAQAHLLIAYRLGRPDNGCPFDRWEDYNPYDRTKIPDQQPTVMDNYRLIVEDLDKAYELLPWFEEYGDADYGRAHKAACLAYKIKALAYWAQYDNTKWAEIPAIADKIENDGHRALCDSYYDVFTLKNEWSSEYILCSVNN